MNGCLNFCVNGTFFSRSPAMKFLEAKLRPKEIRFFVRRCLNPLFAARAIGAIGWRAVRSAQRRLRSRQAFYPVSVEGYYAAVASRQGDVGVSRTSEERFAVGEGALQLAVGELRYDGNPAWDVAFEDGEIAESVHRWNWLLTSVSVLPKADRLTEGVALMQSWVADHAAPTPGEAWGTYSTGERIANAGLFLALNAGWDREKGLYSFCPALQRAVETMADHVARNLEYGGPETTGNHALNNARSLLFAGEGLGRPEYSHLAWAILRERLPELVTVDGFLREGSSHYHFLFTRWVLEMIWVAEHGGNIDAVNYLRRFASRLVERCWFFLVPRAAMEGWAMPLVGDVSPDFPPEWLFALPWSRLALQEYRPARLRAVPEIRGWAGLWPAIDVGQASVATIAMTSIAQSFPHSHWHRVDYCEWTLFVYAPSDDGAVCASHRHTDLGSFALFYGGVEVFADSGRACYGVGDPVGEYGLSARAHNTVLLDDCGPMPEVRLSRLPSFYRAVKVSTAVRAEEGEAVVTITHDGFSRLYGTPVIHTRSLSLGRNRFSVDDRLQGAGVHTAQVIFQFGPELDLRSSPAADYFELTLRGQKGQCWEFVADPHLVQGAPARAVALRGQISRAYGKIEQCTTLVFSQEIELPWTQRHALTLKNIPCVA